MAFVTRTLPALLIAASMSVALLAPQAAEARNGQNAALIAGALLGVAAGSALTQSAQADDGGYTVVEPSPQPVYRPRYERPVYDDGYDDGYRPVYRDDRPRYRVIDDSGWSRHEARWDRRDYGRRPCPEGDWRRYGDY